MNSNNLISSLVSVDWLKKHIDTSNLIILDATLNKSCDKDSIRIPKARFFDIKQKFSDINAAFPSTLPSAEQFQLEARNLGINKDSILVVYDDKGIYSSARAWWLFKTFGFDNVAVLDGGLPQWKQSGFDTDTYSKEAYPKGDFESCFKPNLMTDFDGVNDLRKASDTLIIDARSRGRFQCKDPEPRIGLRMGTIPGSVNLPYTELFDGNRLKPRAKLSLIFNTLVKDKATLVFSCGSGITACILALAASQCNFKNLVVYDGSWTEYGTQTH